MNPLHCSPARFMLVREQPLPKWAASGAISARLVRMADQRGVLPIKIVSRCFEPGRYI